MSATTPAPPIDAQLRLVRSAVGDHLFVVDGSRLYDLEPAMAAAVDEALGTPGHPLIERLTEAFLGDPPRIDGAPLEPPPLRSISLNVAQGCNLACGYCYADEGRFGGEARRMSSSVARASVDRLLAECGPGVDAVVGFMGGEPLLARELIHEITAYATRRAAAAGCRVRFSVTTNATRITAEDAALFHEHGFSVSVSLDGPPELNDRQRPTLAGHGSYAMMRRGLDHLLAARPGHLSGRITLTPTSGPMRPLLDHALGLGFDDVGFAPVVASPDGAMDFGAADFGRYLEGLIDCGEAAKASLLAGRRYPFTNFETALNEIHRGSHRPYPCGAGAAYLSASAEGELYACHRLIDDESMRMGDVFDGSDVGARRTHLAQRHVDRQAPCSACWARYLCGGGCYHEIDRRGRLACDAIRGWLDFCLSAYAELSARRPLYFVDPDRAFDGPPSLIDPEVAP